MIELLLYPASLLDDLFSLFVGIVTVHLPKLNHGEYFQNLGMLTALLAKKPSENVSKVISKPLIEVLEGILSMHVQQT